MRNYLIAFLLLTTWTITNGQNNLINKYNKADSLYLSENYLDALPLYAELEKEIDKEDTLYADVLWYYGTTLWQLELTYRNSMDWKNSLKYALECEKVLEKAEGHLSDKYLSRKYWLYKNVTLAYFGLDQIDKARSYQDKLYQAYKDKKLPDGLDQHYNFEKLVWDNKNVWGYEWFEELPEDRFSKSFSKIVYYVYSTNPDGSDKDQLYRLHVLMFHNIEPSVKIDYVLTKRLETATDEVSGTFYAYTYESPVNFQKLRADIREVLKGNYQPDTKSKIKKKK